MTNQDFDHVLKSIRDDVPDVEIAHIAAERVREKLNTTGPNGLCEQFRADLIAYRAGRLPEGRRMLIEDHLHSCVACRREYSGVRNALVVPISGIRQRTVRR